MCGIAGSLDFAGQSHTPQTMLEAMGRALAHRGPDECGLWTAGPVGLAVQRLRVVDLVTGQQPRTSPDGCLHVVANGEIYNADSLREDLLVCGYVYFRGTHTELIRRADAEDGTGC